MATVAKMPIHPIATRSSVISKAQDPTAPGEAHYQLIECRRLVRDLSCEPNLAVPTGFRNTDDDRRLMYVQPDKGDTLSHGPSPVLRQVAGLPGATLVIPAQPEAGHPASDGHLDLVYHLSAVRLEIERFETAS